MAKIKDIRGRIAFYGSTPAYAACFEHHGLDALAKELNRLSRGQRWGDMAALVGDDVLGCFAVGRLLRAVGEERAATDLASVAATLEPGVRPTVGDLLRDASGTWTWAGPDGAHDAALNATLVGLVRDLLVGDATEHGAPHEHLDLSPTVPEAWLGQGWEVHDLPTRHGLLSYAVRWHGDRPALLWQLDPVHDRPLVVRAPGLDPVWHSPDPVGEVLLGPVALPEQGPRRGLTMPVTIEPLHRRAAEGP